MFPFGTLSGDWMDCNDNQSISVNTSYPAYFLKHSLLIRKGECGDDWIALARENIYQHIGMYDEDGLQFNLLSLCESPLVSVPKDLARNSRKLLAVEKKLSSLLPEWEHFVETSQVVLESEPHGSKGISEELVANIPISDSEQQSLEEIDAAPSQLLESRQGLLTEKDRLHRMYIEEIALVEQENEQAARRKVDHTPSIYNAIKTFAEKQVLREIIQDLP
jgi:ubiquitin carboxyl-terminal hydrolase L5